LLIQPSKMFRLADIKLWNNLLTKLKEIVVCEVVLYLLKISAWLNRPFSCPVGPWQWRYWGIHMASHYFDSCTWFT
jgi:hypothetical protein